MNPKVEKSFKKEEILKKSLTEIQNKSYNAISYEKLSKALNMPKSSLYNYFKSKEELGLAALKYYHEKISNQIGYAEKNFKNPIEKLDGYFSFFRRLIYKNDRLCLGQILTIEINSLSDNFQDAIKNLFKEQFNWLTKILHEGRDQELFKFSGSSEHKAALIESTVQGATMLSRMLGKDQYDRIVKEIKTDLLAVQVVA